MKILYGIQGTGNGHITRAIQLIPHLQKIGKVDILISGLHHDIQLPFDVKFQQKGFGFFFGKNGGIDWLKTLKKQNFGRFMNELQQIPVNRYDVILSDFEPITAWAAKIKDIKCLGLSHQTAMLSKKTPKPKSKEYIGENVLKHYAPVSDYIGFHFKSYDKNIFTPVLRNKILESTPKEKNHFSVYLPAYSDARIIKVLRQVKGVQWEVFSKHSNKTFSVDNIQIKPVHEKQFTKSIVNSRGILCGAGFETPAEAMHLNKKLMVIPMKGQYEQKCNAVALEKLKVPTLNKLSNSKVDHLREWVASDISYQKVHYSDIAENIANLAVRQYLS